MNKSEFVFSIIIPVYNTEKYIEKTQFIDRKIKN